MEKYIRSLLILAASLAIIFVLLPIAELLGWHLVDKGTDLSIAHLNAACIIILNYLLAVLTGILVCVAYNQLTGIRKTTKADFLLRIDNRYGNKPVIKARAIIHRLYLEAGKTPNICKEKRDKELAEKIKALYDSDKCEDFIYLLNFLDFLETVAYFANREYLSPSELKELLGGSLTYFHKVFIPLRDHLRHEYHDDKSYYAELDTLVDKINDKKTAMPGAQTML